MDKEVENKRKGVQPLPKIGCSNIPQTLLFKYFGVHLDSRLVWRDHIKTKSKPVDIKTRQLYWLLDYRSEFDFINKILLYKMALKPIWTYNTQLWWTVNYSKMVQLIANASYYVSNRCFHNDLGISYFIEKIRKLAHGIWMDWLIK